MSSNLIYVHMSRRIAIFFSGRVNCYENSIDHLQTLKNMYDCDFFMSINHPHVDTYHSALIDLLHVRSFSFENHDVVYNLNSWESKLDLKPLPPSCQAYYTLSSMYYNNMKAFELITNYQKENQFCYDIVVKFRADLLTSDILHIPLVVEENTIYIPEGHDFSYISDNLDLGNKSLEGINDQVAFGKFNAMSLYTSLFSNIEYYCKNERVPYHPEVLLNYHLQQMGLKVVRFNYEYKLNENRKYM